MTLYALLRRLIAWGQRTVWRSEPDLIGERLIEALAAHLKNPKT